MKINYRIFVLIFLIFHLNHFNLSSNDKKDHYLGVFGGTNFIFNSTEIPIYYGSDDCGTFKSGINNGLNFGLFYTAQNYLDLIDFDIRFFYESRPVSLSANTQGFEVFNPSNKVYEPLFLQHNYDGKLQYVSFDIGIKYNPIPEIPLFTRLGIEAGNPIISADFENTEQIVSPSGFLFPDEKVKHTVEKGKLNDAGTAFGASLSISYKHLLPNEIFVEPTLTFRKSLNSVLRGTDWNQDIIRLTISLGYEFNYKKNELIRENPINEIIITNDTVVAKVENKNPEIKTTDIYLQEQIVTQTYPILPYIFFESDNSELMRNYKNNFTQDFDVSKLPNDNLQIYYEILNIIGSRLNKYPESSITLFGTQDSKENLIYPDYSLAKSRADKVAKYLSDVCKINKDRINISFLRKPTLPTSESYIEGFAENRRVEIVAEDFRLIEPVVHRKFSEYKNITTNFYITASKEIDEKKWNIDVKLNNQNLSTLSGNEKLPDFIEIERLLRKSSIKPDDNLLLTLNLTTRDNKDFSIQKKIDIKHSTEDFEAGRLNLIVFDFDKFELSEFNKQMIRNFVKSEVKKNSKIKIIGSTDRLGEMDYNLKLSQQRADNVSNFLKQLIPDINITETKGIGFNNTLNNDLPEGRFYSRTVLIQVETPLEK